MPNIQVTHGSSLNDARSESVLVINPNNPAQIVGASRKCKNISAYDFTVATVFSTDGGITWHDSAPLATPGWSGLSDPALAWDDIGNVFFVGSAIKNPPTIDYVGVAVYKSTDGGKTWSAPNLIHASSQDEKQWAAGDSGSPAFHGRVYIVWDDGTNLRFARTLDHGATWIGAGTDPAGSILATDSFSPEINVSADGAVYIVRNSYAGHEIKMIVSNDGGDSFHPVTSPATGITTLEASVPPWKPGGWPVLPGSTFRVFTIPTACVFGKNVAVAWADYREGVSRIYYAMSTDGGASWTTGPSGQPLLKAALPANFQHFHPQIVTNPDGVIGCAFYEYGPKPSTHLIDVIMAESVDWASFSHFRVTDHPWDPTIDAPVSLVDPIASFIGEYFGLDASGKGFYPFWTDTRTGIQELWTDIVPALRVFVPRVYQEVAQILFGIIQDGGGTETVGGHKIHIPPWGPPELDILLGVACHRIAALISGHEGLALQRAAMTMVARVAQQEIQRLSEVQHGR